MVFGKMKVSMGGLMRCCLETLGEIDPKKRFKEGDTIDCKYEKKPTMIVKKGVIIWNSGPRP